MAISCFQINWVRNKELANSICRSIKMMFDDFQRQICGIMQMSSIRCPVTPILSWVLVLQLLWLLIPWLHVLYLIALTWLNVNKHLLRFRYVCNIFCLFEQSYVKSTTVTTAESQKGLWTPHRRSCRYRCLFFPAITLCIKRFHFYHKQVIVYNEITLSCYCSHRQKKLNWFTFILLPRDFHILQKSQKNLLANESDDD